MDDYGYGILTILKYMAILLLVLFIVSSFMLLIGMIGNNYYSNTQTYQGQVTSAEVYTQSGGFLSGSTIHDLITIQFNRTQIYEQTFHCNYYEKGMNVSIVETISYNIFENPSFPASLFLPNYPNNLTTIAHDWNGTAVQIHYNSANISYSVQNIPQGC